MEVVHNTKEYSSYFKYLVHFVFNRKLNVTNVLFIKVETILSTTSLNNVNVVYILYMQYHYSE